MIGTVRLVSFPKGLQQLAVRRSFGREAASRAGINGCCHLRRTSELPNVRPGDMVHIGSRGLWNLREQWQYCKEAGIHVYRMRDVRQPGIERVVAEALEIASEGTEAVALDVDLDVLDCPHAPGVCSPEPGGLTARELLDAVDLLHQEGPYYYVFSPYAKPIATS